MRNIPNADMKIILDEHQELAPLPIETLTADFARQVPLLDRAAVAAYGHHFTKRAFAPMPMPVGKITHRTIAGLDDDVLIRIYTPSGNQPDGGWPAVVYYHGGGWVIATLDTYDSSCRALCGNGRKPRCIRRRCLIYPVTDLEDGPNSSSARENAQAKPLNQAMLTWFYDQYAGDVSRTDFRVSPLYADSHAGLSSATIILAEIDPLRDDGEAYAAKLQNAGVPVRLKIFEGVTHEFFGLAGLVGAATEAVKLAGDSLKEAFDEVEKNNFARAAMRPCLHVVD